jgi:predicted acetyltransferase
MRAELCDARTSALSRAFLRRLFPLYIHDLSPHTSFYSLDARGRWRPELWREWLSNPYLDPWLIRAGGEVVGFAITAHRPFPYMSPDRQHKLCEFFILAGHRRRGFGQTAAGLVIDRHAGSWELTILPTNAGAHRFWKSMLAARGPYEELQLPGDIVMRFESRGPPGQGNSAAGSGDAT